jgi:hypothetical protein
MVGRLAFLLILLGWLPAGGRAEPSPPLEQARLLFARGLEQAERQLWTEARAAFESAYALAPRPAVLFNLAGAQARVGKLLVSLANYRRFLALDDPAIAPTHRSAAREQIAAIERRVPRLRLVVAGLRPDDRLLLDDKRIYLNELDHDLWLDPGSHTVSVHRPGGHEEVRRLVLAEGDERTLQFRVF